MANFYATFPAAAAGSNPSVGTDGQTAPTFATEVGGIGPDGNLHPISTDNSGNQNVNVVSSTLPAGAATAANQVTQESTLTAIQANQTNGTQTTTVSGNVTVVQPTGSSLHVNVDSLPSIPAGANAIGSVSVSNFPATQPVSAVSLPLPAGASTAALQSNVQSAPGTSATTAITIQGSASGAAVPISGTVAISSFPSEQNVNLNQVGGSAVAIGQQTTAASIPVVLPASQITTLTPPTSVTVTQATAANLNATAAQGAPSTVANAWPVKNTDGTNVAAVKAASTSPAAADPALVVALSPNGAQATSALQTTGNTSLASIATNTTLATACYSGQKTSTGTAVAIATSQAIVTGVIVQALSTNAGNVYVGPSGVTTSTGFQLQPGQATSVAINNLSSVYVIAATSGDGVCYMGS